MEKLNIMPSKNTEPAVTELKQVISYKNNEEDRPEWELRKRYNIDQLTSKGMDDLLKLKEKLLKLEM